MAALRVRPVRAATGVAAELLDQAGNVGAAAVGRHADLLAAPRDVSRDVRAIGRVTFVTKGGPVVRGPESAAGH